MAWRVAKALDVLRNQVNTKWPTRSRASDGSIGDVAHAKRASDHNPNSAGVVTAIDITHDPKAGCNGHSLAEAFVASKDQRIKFIIWNGRICSGSNQKEPAWKWRKYGGVNPHNHHIHISVKSNADNYDSAAKWALDAGGATVPDDDYVAPPPTLRKGSQGEDVKRLQLMLGIKVDGDFGPKTQEAVVAFQAKVKILADGVVGPHTWAVLTQK